MTVNEHIKNLANDYKCWDNTITHEEAVELDRLINNKTCYKMCHKWDYILEDVKAELNNLDFDFGNYYDETEAILNKINSVLDKYIKEV